MFTWEWGHWDELENCTKIHGPFTWPVQLNIIADQLTGTTMQTLLINPKAVKKNCLKHNANGSL